MDITLMSFSMMAEGAKGKLSADKLCEIAAANQITMMDLMDVEVKLYGEEKLREAMEARGIQCGCIIAGCSFYEAPEKVETELRLALELTERMHAPILMVVPGQPTPGDKESCGQMTKQEILDRAVEKFRLAVELATPMGIRIGFENTPQDYKPLASPQDCKYVLEKVPGLGLIFDTGNFRVADTSCDELAIYEELKEYIIRFHLKDVVIGDFTSGERCTDGQYIRPVTTGSGVIPMEELLKRLKRDQYHGALAVEYSAKEGIHGTEHGKWVSPYVSFIRSALAGGVERPPYVKIPGIELPVPRIFFGTAIMPMLMGKNVEALLDAMMSCGIYAFDCARGYGGAEKSLGEWIQERNNRDRVVILTKCGNVSMGGKVCVNRAVIEEELAESLKTLHTGYIDIYLLHRDDPNTPVSEIIDCLNEAKKQGKIKVFGVSNWTHERIEEANAYAKEHNLEGVSVSSPNFGLAEQVTDPWGGGCVTVSGPSNKEARNWYAANQMPLIAYSSLGRGFFSGKFKSGDYSGAKKVLDSAGQKGYLCKANMERLRRAEELADQKGCGVSGIAFQYIFSSAMNVFAVVSTTSPERMGQNIHAALSSLTEEEVQGLENV